MRPEKKIVLILTAVLIIIVTYVSLRFGAFADVVISMLPGWHTTIYPVPVTICVLVAILIIVILVVYSSLKLFGMIFKASRRFLNGKEKIQ